MSRNSELTPELRARILADISGGARLSTGLRGVRYPALLHLMSSDSDFARDVARKFDESGRKPPKSVRRALELHGGKTHTSTPDPHEEAKPGTWRPDDSERPVPLPVENPSTPAGVWLPVDDPEKHPEDVEPRQDSLEPGPANSDPRDTPGAAGTTRNPARESSASLNPPYRRRRQVLASQEPQSPQVPSQSRTSLTTAFQRRRWSHH
jgi:hypothetical protein